MNPKEEKKAREIIKKIVLLNAIRYDGKAAKKPVFGKLLGEHPEFRRKIEEITPIINEIVQEINLLPMGKQRKIVKEKWPEALREEKTEETKQLPPLPNVEKYDHVVTRFSPNPNFVLHLGSARALILSHEYAKIYNGSFILRFEDTDSKTKKPKLEFYQAIREDLKWLGCRWDSEFIQSDRLEIYYKHAEELIEAGNAYVCTCLREVFHEKAQASQFCPCRMLSTEENLLRWNRMLNGTYGEGEAVVRTKTDMDHPNPAVRDWPALRIIDPEKYPHPRVGCKYRVWPLYNFSTGIDDHLMGITHIIRGKEHLTNQARQEYMYKHFGWNYPETIHYGRLKVEGSSLSKSEIMKGLASGLYEKCDDPRLATLAALRKRGITSEAIHSLMIEIGPKPADVVLSWKNLYAYNRKQIEPNAKRYFFVRNPIKTLIKNVPHAFLAQIPVHPDYPEKGFRLFEVKPTNGAAAFLISKDDLDVVKNKQIIRLMDLFNFRTEKVDKTLVQAIFLGDSYEEAKKMGAPLIHWIPVDSGFPCEVVMPDASVARGEAEEACKALKSKDIVQFQRFGFVRIDEVNEKLKAYFAHR
ncbi:MAG: glutamate--tRNA ligase [Candidatus Bathyarchaeota archaeon]|nr:glutamate--tRNA ligase [Candidatus Bathyarchaeota archaeon]